VLVAATLISFPQSRNAYAAIAAVPTETMRSRGLHLVTSGVKISSTSASTQAQANRIVAQIEQEIARQAYSRNQRSLGFRAPVTPLHPVHEMETPASVARRIFHALKSFARSA
jgi:hypothetical protein